MAAGHFSTLSKEDFPAEISLMYLVTKNSKKAFFAVGGESVKLSDNN